MQENQKFIGLIKYVNMSKFGVRKGVPGGSNS